MRKGDNSREGKGKDLDITTGKGERKLMGKGKKGKEESKENVIIDWMRKGDGKSKRNMYRYIGNLFYLFTSYRLGK